MIVRNTMFPLARSFQQVTDLQQIMDKLQGQLATGKKAETLSDLGRQTSYDLGLRDNISRLDSFGATIDTVKLRLDMLDTTQKRIIEIRSDAKDNVRPGGFGSDGAALSLVPNQAKTQLTELVDLFNTELNGRHLFAGNRSDAPPVATIGALLDGANGADGFRTVAGQRNLADLGVGGMGRLATSQTVPTNVTLAEDGVHPFGYKLSSVSTDSAGAISVTSPAGAPASLAVDFSAVPAAGETVVFKFALPDGSDTSVTMTAVSGAPTSSSEFQLGADAATTATNFKTALEAKLVEEGKSSLKAASTLQAANEFFTGVGETAQRVAGPPYDTATALVAATPADTVQWYTGSDIDPPRSSVSAKISHSTTLDYGVQANESGYTNLVRNVAALAVQNFDPNVSNDRKLYDAFATREQKSIAEATGGQGNSLEIIAAEIGLAHTTLGRTEERHTAYKGQLQGMLDEVEQAPIEEVAMQLLALQTQLQASYQTMSSVSKLTLVNYL